MNNSYEFNLIKLFNRKPNKYWSLEDIKEELQIVKSKKEKELIEVLIELETKGNVYKNKKNQYILSDNAGVFTGVVTKVTSTYLFVRANEEEVFVPLFNPQYFTGDTVLLKQIESETNGKKKVCKILKVLQSNRMYIIGTFLSSKDGSFVEIEENGNKRLFEVINNLKASDGNTVVANLEKQVEGKFLLEQVLGHKDQPSIDMLSTIFKHNIKLEFDEATLQEAEECNPTFDEEEYYMRTDLREDFTFTIDGEDSKDLDDAVSLRILDNGNFLLGVHIADVSYYVTKNSALDKEAYERGTSVYLINKVIPMLPQRLSNNICSLNPDVERLTVSCEMEIDKSGNVVRYDIFESVIQSKFRLTYEEVNHYFATGDLKHKDAELAEKLMAMKSLMGILQAKRFQAGAIEFESKEVKFDIDKSEQVLGLKVRERKQAERLIEEFMLIANETVATYFGTNGLPFIYRIHDVPNENKIGEVRKILTSIGYQEEIPNVITKPSQIKHILESIMDNDLKSIISPILIRMMSKAVYTKENIGHFGLMKEFYTHFTSPIRRYPDLIVHRLIREMIIEKKMSKKNREYWEREIEPIAGHSSSKEQKAAEAEREMVEKKKIEYMEPFIGADFEARITAMNEHGLFVELENTVQGFIHTESIGGLYVDETYMYQLPDGFLKVGDILDVKLVSLDKTNIKVNFEIN